MQKVLTLAVGAVFGIVLVATCGGKMGTLPDAGAQSGPTRMLTADTDADQLTTGTIEVPANSPTKVLDGPFVLTDLMNSGALVLSVVAGSDCTQVGRSIPFTLQNARWVVKNGESLCATSGPNVTLPNSLTWNGFKPY